MSFPVFGLLGPGSPDKSFDGFGESKTSLSILLPDFELLLLPSFLLFPNILHQ